MSDPPLSAEQTERFRSHLADRLDATDLPIAPGQYRAMLLGAQCDIETALSTDSAGNPIFDLCARPLVDTALGTLFPRLPAAVPGVVLREVTLEGAILLYIDSAAPLDDAAVRRIAGLFADARERSFGPTDAGGALRFAARSARSVGTGLTPLFDALGPQTSPLTLSGGLRFPRGWPELFVRLPIPALQADASVCIATSLCAPSGPATITLAAAIRLGPSEALAFTTTMPLDGRSFTATATLGAGSAFLSGALPETLAADFAPPRAAAAPQLTLSRAGAALQLKRIVFELSLPAVSLGELLEITAARAQVMILQMLGTRRTVAMLTVTARIGSIALRGTASYPDRIFTLGLAPDAAPTLADLFSLFRITVTETTPSRIDRFRLDYAGGFRLFTFEVGVAGAWPIGPLQLEQVEFALLHDSQRTLASAQTRFTLGPVLFALSARYASGDWKFDGSATGRVQANALLGAIAGQFGITPPASFLAGLALTAAVTIDTLSGDTASGEFAFAVAAELPIGERPARVAVTVTLTRATSGYNSAVTGTLDFAGHMFRVDSRSEAGEGLLVAEWSGDKPLGLSDILRALGLPLDIPPELDLGVSALSFAYKGGDKAIFAATARTRGGQASLLAYRSAATWIGAISVDIGVTIDLAKLPLLDGVLPDRSAAALTIETVTCRSEMFGEDQHAAVATVWTAFGGVATPALAPVSGFSLTLRFDAGGQARKLSLGGSVPQPRPRIAAAAAAPANAAGRRWIEVDKRLGPVSLRRVGLGWDSPKLEAVLEASLAVGGLTLDLIGLGAAIPVGSFTPAFTFDGIDIGYANGPVKIEGGLTGKVDGAVDLAGQLTVQTKTLSLAALAAFTTVDGAPSMFAVALLKDRPLGGPPASFVTGIAAGIALNRDLALPALDGVTDFPLVQWATGSGPAAPVKPADVLAQLGTAVAPPSVGRSWIAAGVRFTSFRLMDSLLLLFVPLAGAFRLDLIGTSRLALPTGAANPFVLIELAIKASIDPASGLLAVDGALSPKSYVLSKDCHLTGGFAFYSWFAGPHAGEFVVTGGGYSPRFTVPPHYPTVPRLGIRWQVSDELSIIGSEYFALTSAAIMAGGRLEAVWRSGSIRAWFTLEADFLLYYWPLRYEARFRCELGCSFEIDLWLTTVRISAHIGVAVDIWGPDFSVEIEVDLSLISFRIRKGSAARHGPALSWDEFIRTLLPAPESLIQLRMTKGLLQTLSEQDDATNDVVDPQNFEMLVTAAIPCKNATIGDAITDPAITVMDPPASRDFGVAPCRIPSAEFAPSLLVSITASTNSRFKAVRERANVPASLWGEFPADRYGAPTVDPLNRSTISNVQIGWRLFPDPPPPLGRTKPVPKRLLEASTYESKRGFGWSPGVAPAADPDGAQGLSPDAAANRRAILAAAGFIGDATPSDLADPPVWSRLGQPQPRLVYA